MRARSAASGSRRGSEMCVIERRSQRIAGARPHGVEEATRIVLGQCREIEEAGDVVHVEQMHLVGTPRQAHGDDGHAREIWISLPRLERYGREEVVLAEHDVRHVLVRGGEGIRDSDDAPRVDAQLSKEVPEMVAQELMATHTQCLQCASLSRHGSTLASTGRAAVEGLDSDTTRKCDWSVRD
jgi:hypothetical protein